jgi:arginine transport system permease protein
MNEFFPLASAAGMTVGLAVCALIVGLALAMFFAVWESAKWRPVAWAGSALVTILRGLPEILVVGEHKCRHSSRNAGQFTGFIG